MENLSLQNQHLLLNIRYKTLCTGLKIPLELFKSNDLCLKDSNNLILRFSDRDCLQCVEDHLSLLLDPSFFSQKIIVLGGHQIKRNFDIYLLKLKEKTIYSHLWLPKPNLHLPIEYENQPYYLLINKEGVVQDIYIPSKHNFEFDKGYIKSWFSTSM